MQLKIAADKISLMAAKQITKDQHYVPRFYLKRFANPAGKLEIFDCENERMLRARAYGGVCYEKFFYSSETGKEDEVSQVVEEAFGKMETGLSIELAQIIPKIENNQALTVGDRLTVATLMSMLWLRGPVMRKQINRMEEQVLKEVMARHSIEHLSELAKKLEAETGQVMGPEEVQEMHEFLRSREYSLSIGNGGHLRFQQEMEGFRNLFYGKKWNVYLARGRYKFITTDNPVAEYFPETNGWWGNDFLSRTHMFALTPTILIEAVYPHHTTGKKLRRKTLFDTVQDQALMLKHNFFLANKAVQFAYSTLPTELQQLHQSIEGFRTAGLMPPKSVDKKTKRQPHQAPEQE